MPNIKSAEKRVLVSEKKRVRNRPVRTAVRTYIKAAEKNMGLTGRIHVVTDQATESVQRAIQALDKAQSKGVLHPNNVARRKSRLMHKLHTVAQQQAAK